MNDLAGHLAGILIISGIVGTIDPRAGFVWLGICTFIELAFLRPA